MVARSALGVLVIGLLVTGGCRFDRSGFSMGFLPDGAGTVDGAAAPDASTTATDAVVDTASPAPGFDRGGPDLGSFDLANADAPSPDTLAPDVLAPDTLAPDTRPLPDARLLSLGKSCTSRSDCASGFCECRDGSSGCARRICCVKRCPSGDTCDTDGKDCD